MKYFIWLALVGLCSGVMAENAHNQWLYPLPNGFIPIPYESISGYAVTEGDILLGEILPHTTRMEAMTVTLESRCWPDGIVPYLIDQALPQANQQAVREAILYWQQYTNITFVELSPDTLDQYKDYAVFAPDYGHLCASYVGRKGGRQVVELSPRCNKRIVLHEIGHLVGLWHEQSRADRDLYVRILWENIDPVSRYNFEKKLNDGADYKEYDYQSLMHYSQYAFSKNGKKTIEPLLSGVTIGQQDGLSPLDQAAVYMMYRGPIVPESVEK